MAKNSIDAYGASGKSNVLFFEPENLHLVTDTTHPLYDERVHLPLNEAVILNIMELGVLEPIIVWKDPETGKTCVVAGRQRVKNAKEANARRKRAGLESWPVPVSQILALTDEKPAIGQRTGKNDKTHWIIFVKGAAV
ncbi:ParB N-terminal domain-containing protein [Klebsiella variicola]|uniref:ParB N-terminal domain-containing protein n=1 Tax=Klebsiella variicola TaxID=244366 RepID=UPI00350F745D